MPRKSQPEKAPADVAAVTTAIVDPRTETDAETWHRWSQDRHQRDLEQQAATKAHNDTMTTAAVYPREIAQAIAHDAAHAVIPDWRLLRTEHGGLLKRLIAQQPEARLREVQQFAPLLRLMTDNLPPHIRPLVQDLEAIIELRAVAREAAAFFVGMETGRRLAQQHIDGQGRLRGSRRAVRKPAPEAPETCLRLHLEPA